MQQSDGMNYAPQGAPNAVCGKGEFLFAAVGLDHGHIYGMCNGLLEAGAELRTVWDPDPSKVEAFLRTYPGVRAARSEQEVLDDGGVRLIASAAVPCQRGALGARVMDHGKDFFSDKPPFTSLDQLASARRKVAETGLKHAVYYAERLHVEAAVHAGHLLEQGAIGRVLSVLGLGPHRLNAAARPAWFWDKAQNGGILCDIGSHQVEQFLHFAGAKSARLLHSKVAHYDAAHPDFEDYGDAAFVADNAATSFMRLDWYTPKGLGAWGDGRTFITGTEGTLELRKYLDVARDAQGDQLYLVDEHSEQRIAVRGKVGFPYFGQLILDCLHRTEHAMTQEHAFLAIELALTAQLNALAIA